MFASDCDKQSKVVHIVTLIVFVFFIQTEFSQKLGAQPIPTVKITGTVLEEKSMAPISGVDVFLSNTTLNSLTDENGKYLIGNVPLGMYQLVASKNGYELEVNQFRLSEPSDLELIFKLQTGTIPAKNQNKKVKKTKEWKQIFKLFEMNFLGTSKYSKKCNILNPEVLEFNYDNETKALTAKASEPIKIENKELGYKITYFLSDFYSQGIFTATSKGYAKYEQFPTQKEKDKKKWNKNRRDVYNGSLRHFLTALTKNQAKEQGFLMFNVTALTEKYEDMYLKEIHEDAIIKNGEIDFEKKLTFTDYVKVIYKFEGESREFSQYADQNPNVALEYLKSVRPEGTRLEEQISAIYLSLPHITINALGQIYNPLGITIFGHWSWENKLATTLPINYELN